VSIPRALYEQHLLANISKVQKDTDDLTVSFCQNVTRKAAKKRLSYEKFARLTLMKLTPVRIGEVCPTPFMFALCWETY